MNARWFFHGWLRLWRISCVQVTSKIYVRYARAMDRMIREDLKQQGPGEDSMFGPHEVTWCLFCGGECSMRESYCNDCERNLQKYWVVAWKRKYDITADGRAYYRYAMALQRINRKAA